MNNNIEIAGTIVSNEPGRELTRHEKSIIYCLRTLNELVKTGLLTGGMYQLTEKAQEAIEDFKPTDEEMELAMNALKRDGAFG